MLPQRALAYNSCHRPCDTVAATAVGHLGHAPGANPQSTISAKPRLVPTLQTGRRTSLRYPKQLTRASYSQASAGDRRLEVHHVHKRLPLRCVALGDEITHVISCEDGRNAWSGGLSDGLHATLLATRKYGKQIATVALGRNQGSDTYNMGADCGEMWFLRRDTGTTYMGKGCEWQLREEWRNSEGEERVEKVVFAPSNCWHLSRRGGGEQRQDLPSSLTKHMTEAWYTGDRVQSMSVGHNGEYFVRYKSGRYAWSGVHPTLDRLLKKQKVGGRACSIEWVELGPDGTFVALFDTHTVWYGGEALTEDLLSCL